MSILGSMPAPNAGAKLPSHYVRPASLAESDCICCVVSSVVSSTTKSKASACKQRQAAKSTTDSRQSRVDSQEPTTDSLEPRTEHRAQGKGRGNGEATTVDCRRSAACCPNNCVNNNDAYAAQDNTPRLCFYSASPFLYLFLSLFLPLALLCQLFPKESRQTGRASSGFLLTWPRDRPFALSVRCLEQNAFAWHLEFG